MKRTLALCSALALALSLSACGDNQETPDEQTTSAAGEQPQVSTDTDLEISDQPLFDVAGAAGEEPTITFNGDAPAGLHRYVMDENPDGVEIGATDAVLALYHGQVWNGDVFDSAYQRHEPVAFPLTGVIPGWQKGLSGTRVGERVQLVIPPEQGYPEGTPDGSIKPGETIVFVVEVLDVASLSAPGDSDAKAEMDPADAGVKITRAADGALQSAELLDAGVEMDPMKPFIIFTGSDQERVEDSDQVALRMVRLTSDEPQSDVADELMLFQGAQLPEADKLHVGSVIVAGEGKAGEMAETAVVFEVIKIFKP